ncbi:hypothetical protein BH09BAC2_BH09BAC2_12180 [soil metagenome]
MQLSKFFFGVFFFLILSLFNSKAFTQIQDTVVVQASAPPDSSKLSRKNPLAQDTTAKKFNPKIATLRSALIPGWGQAYNKKYWKIPIIYAALGTTAGIFIYNNKYYKKLRQAYIYRTDTIKENDALVDPEFINLSTESIRSYRNEFRQNIDYSVLFFILFWGLNVVDATVDAHLKSFDVSDDLSLKIKPFLLKNNNTAGITLALSFKDPHKK